MKKSKFEKLWDNILFWICCPSPSLHQEEVKEYNCLPCWKLDKDRKECGEKFLGVEEREATHDNAA